MNEQPSLGITDFIPQRIAFLEAEKERISGAIAELKRMQSVIKVVPVTPEAVEAQPAPAE